MNIYKIVCIKLPIQRIVINFAAEKENNTHNYT